MKDKFARKVRDERGLIVPVTYLNTRTAAPDKED